MSQKTILIFLTIAGLILQGSFVAKAQCLSLPYFERFETSNGGWTTGGIASDWEWGTPVKSTLIPLDGTKCWTTGGLTKNNYNANQLSWLQSPCFDFSNIEYPYVEFRSFGATQQAFDGVVFEYSLDSGLVWQTAGSFDDGFNCVTGNWFNAATVTALNNGPGWSGIFFWRWAYHSFPFLAGESKVMFRFVFGSNATNNNYDGFAIDDFYAGEADTTNATFTFECKGNALIDFRAASNSGCAYYLWDFDDPASGAADSSDLPNPSHTFSGPGQYTVTLYTHSTTNAPDTTTQIINVLGLTTKVINHPDCKGFTNGVASVSITPVIDNVTYSWDTHPAQNNDTATNLGPGVYTVLVTAPNACAAQQASVTIIEPTQVSNDVGILNPSCNQDDGTINISTTGGTAPYSYTWSPNVSNAASANSLSPGNYSIVVRDIKGCSETTNIVLTRSGGPVATISNKQDAKCWGDQGSATVSVTGGEAPYSYAWSPSGGTDATASFADGGDYMVTVTDNKGCITTAQASIIEPGLLVSTIIKEDASCGNNGKAIANITGGVMPFTYLWSSPTVTYSLQAIEALVPGQYSLTVTDANGCTVTDAVAIAGGIPIQVIPGHKDVTCHDGQDGNISLVISGGTPAYSVEWDNGSVGTNLANLHAGNYIATVSDAIGCTTKTTVIIQQPAKLAVSLGADTSICKPASIILSPGSYSSYTWQNGSVDPSFVATTEGNYSVTVSDANGCTAQASINITADCGQLYFPNAFTPNGDGLNELFGPSGNLSILKKYNLKIFNRWGNLVFQTNNPFKKWDGKTGGKFIPGVYTWHVVYSSLHQPNGTQKGTIAVIK